MLLLFCLWRGGVKRLQPQLQDSLAIGLLGSQGLGHVGEGELNAAAEAGAEGADGCGDEEDALHGWGQSLRGLCCCGLLSKMSERREF
jgi:hypothetical protein